MNSRFLTCYWLHLPTNKYGARKIDTWTDERIFSKASLSQEIQAMNLRQPKEWLFWM